MADSVAVGQVMQVFQQRPEHQCLILCGNCTVTWVVSVELLHASTDLLCVSDGELFGDTEDLLESSPFFISVGFSELQWPESA